MPKLYFSDHIIKMLLLHGFVFISQKGSHLKYRKIGNPTLTVIVPAGRKEIPMGTFNSIIRQSGLKKQDFEIGLAYGDYKQKSLSGKRIVRIKFS